jgi:hypothetical protein
MQQVKKDANTINAVLSRKHGVTEMSCLLASLTRTENRILGACVVIFDVDVKKLAAASRTPRLARLFWTYLAGIDVSGDAFFAFENVTKVHWILKETPQLCSRIYTERDLLTLLRAELFGVATLSDVRHMCDTLLDTSVLHASADVTYKEQLRQHEHPNVNESPVAILSSIYELTGQTAPPLGKHSIFDYAPRLLTEEPLCAWTRREVSALSFETPSFFDWITENAEHIRENVHFDADSFNVRMRLDDIEPWLETHLYKLSLELEDKQQILDADLSYLKTVTWSRDHNFWIWLEYLLDVGQFARKVTTVTAAHTLFFWDNNGEERYAPDAVRANHYCRRFWNVCHTVRNAESLLAFMRVDVGQSVLEEHAYLAVNELKHRLQRPHRVTEDEAENCMWYSKMALRLVNAAGLRVIVPTEWPQTYNACVAFIDTVADALRLRHAAALHLAAEAQTNSENARLRTFARAMNELPPYLRVMLGTTAAEVRTPDIFPTLADYAAASADVLV